MPEEGTSGTTETTAPAKTENVYKQADVDSITEKVKANYEKKLAAANAEIEKARAAAMSEDEKKLAEARKDAVKEYEAKLTQKERAWSVERKLLAAGVSEEKLGRISLMVDPSIEDPAEAVEALKKEVPELFNGHKNKVGGGGRNAEMAVGGMPHGGWTAENVQRAMNEQPDEQAKILWYKAHQKEILDWQQRNTRSYSIPPGVDSLTGSPLKPGDRAT